jgi:hypothetical protein
MKIDDTYHFLRGKATLAAYLVDYQGESEAYIETFADKLIDQIRKFKETNGIPLLMMPDA